MIKVNGEVYLVYGDFVYLLFLYVIFFFWGVVILVN